MDNKKLKKDLRALRDSIEDFLDNLELDGADSKEMPEEGKDDKKEKA